MKDNKFDFIELIKGLLVVLSYFMLGYLLSALFSVLIYEGILPDKHYIRVILNFSIYLILAIGYVLAYRKQIIEEWKVFKGKPKETIHHGFNYWLRGLFIMLISNFILVFFLKTGTSVNEQTNVDLIKDSMFSQMILVILVAPIIEEIVFRMSFKKMTNNHHLYAFITGLLFGFVHIISSLSSALGFLFIIPYSALGIACGYLYKKTDTIFASLFMHMFHNTVTLAIIILAIVMGVY